MALDELSSGDEKKYPVDSDRYLLLVIPPEADLASGEFDVVVEVGQDFVGDKLTDEEYVNVGHLLSNIAEEYFGYSQARDILQSLYGAV